MNLVYQTELTEKEKLQLLQLWNNEYPANLSYANLSDFNDYLSQLLHPKHILLLDDNGKIGGWYFQFIRESELWFALIIHQKLQGCGFGKKLLSKAQNQEKILNGWVIDHSNNRKQNGETYSTPLPFYLKKGFKVLQNQRLDTEKISAVKIQWKNDDQLQQQTV